MHKLEILKAAYKQADAEGSKWLGEINGLKATGKEYNPNDPVYLQSMIATMRMNAMTEVKSKLAREIGLEIMNA